MMEERCTQEDKQSVATDQDNYVRISSTKSGNDTDVHKVTCQWPSNKAVANTTS